MKPENMPQGEQFEIFNSASIEQLESWVKKISDLVEADKKYTRCRPLVRELRQIIADRNEPGIDAADKDRDEEEIRSKGPELAEILCHSRSLSLDEVIAEI